MTWVFVFFDMETSLNGRALAHDVITGPPMLEDMCKALGSPSIFSEQPQHKLRELTALEELPLWLLGISQSDAIKGWIDLQFHATYSLLCVGTSREAIVFVDLSRPESGLWVWYLESTFKVDWSNGPLKLLKQKCSITSYLPIHRQRCMYSLPGHWANWPQWVNWPSGSNTAGCKLTDSITQIFFQFSIYFALWIWPFLGKWSWKMASTIRQSRCHLFGVILAYVWTLKQTEFKEWLHRHKHQQRKWQTAPLFGKKKEQINKHAPIASKYEWRQLMCLFYSLIYSCENQYSDLCK